MKLPRLLLIINAVLVIFALWYSIYAKEQTLSKGALVLLKLAPRDPRSLLQGDYMALNYEIALDTAAQSQNSISEMSQGYIVIRLDTHRVARRVRLQAQPSPLRSGELLLRYYRNGGDIRLGAEAYFFEEGKAALYEKAVYGGLRLAPNGESILVGLYDKHYRLIEDRK